MTKSTDSMGQESTARTPTVKRLAAKRAGRIVLAAVPVGIAASVLLGGVAQGAVPVSFAISGSQFKISADELDGTSFSQYAGVTKDDKGGEHQVAIANIGKASLANMCQSVVSETPLGKVGVMITAGGGGNPAQATGLQIGMTDLKGDAQFTNIRIGVDASTVNTASKGSSGDFAQDSDAIKISHLKQVSWSTTAAIFVLNGMHVQLTNGTECF
jgi:hypothetical protein